MDKILTTAVDPAIGKDKQVTRVVEPPLSEFGQHMLERALQHHTFAKAVKEVDRQIRKQLKREKKVATPLNIRHAARKQVLANIKARIRKVEAERMRVVKEAIVAKQKLESEKATVNE